MSRAAVVGGSLGGLTAALVLRDQGWEVDVLERSAVPLQGRGAGIVAHPITVRYLVERVGKAIGDIGVPASRLRYLGDDGSVIHEFAATTDRAPRMPLITIGPRVQKCSHRGSRSQPYR